MSFVTVEEFLELKRPDCVYIATSGGYDPIHPGHISSFRDARIAVSRAGRAMALDAKLIVIVNGDEFLMHKKGYCLMDEKARALIVGAIKWVDYVLIHHHDYVDGVIDTTVCSTLEKICPDYFIKGGDRTVLNTPEAELCRKLGIGCIDGVGDSKTYSSSELVNNVIKSQS